MELGSLLKSTINQGAAIVNHTQLILNSEWSKLDFFTYPHDQCSITRFENMYSGQSQLKVGVHIFSIDIIEQNPEPTLLKAHDLS